MRSQVHRSEGNWCWFGWFLGPVWRVRAGRLSSPPPSAPRFLYSDEVQIGPETVMTTLYTAKKYAVPALEAHCVEFLKKNLRADNAFMLLTQVQGWDAGGGAVGQGEDVGEGKAWDPLGHRCRVWAAI